MTARPARAARVRPLLTAVAWIVAFAGAGAALSVLPIRYGPVPPDSPWRFAWNAWVLAAAFVAATGLVAVRLAGVSWVEAGWRGGRSAPLWLGGGAALGGALAALAVGAAVVCGGAVVRVRADPAGGAIAPVALALLGAALAEELVFRGAPLRLLGRALGRWGATLVAALVFGLAHARNPAATPFSIVNIMLAALLLSVAFFSRGGMPLAWGLHFGWNAGLGLGFAAPVSGVALPGGPLVYVPGPRPWVDGGLFGPEGGLVATLAMAAGIVALLGRRVVRPRAWFA
jgi:membrane protease YdiL (CAAX protease family)